jgi:hypothetical protein
VVLAIRRDHAHMGAKSQALASQCYSGATGSRLNYRHSDALLTVKPFCYACGSEEIATYIETPIGCVFGCPEHAENVADFWLLPRIQFTAKSNGHAREHDGNPCKNGGGGASVLIKAVGK